MRLLKESFLFLSIIVLLSAYTPGKNGLDVTFGVCNSENSTVKLELNKDLTFKYYDRSNPDHLIEVKGNYDIDGNTISLTAENSEASFHSKWKIAEDGESAKARKGLSFYRLSKIE